MSEYDMWAVEDDEKRSLNDEKSTFIVCLEKGGNTTCTQLLKQVENKSR